MTEEEELRSWALDAALQINRDELDIEKVMQDAEVLLTYLHPPPKNVTKLKKIDN